MEIKITAVKQKSAYLKTDSKLDYTETTTTERYFPLFELMMKNLQDNQMKNQQRRLTIKNQAKKEQDKKINRLEKTVRQKEQSLGCLSKGL